jgi:polyisoprenyl-phosphate glycosyltransferase
VNDGSGDRSVEVILEKVRQHPGSIKLVDLSRNFGQQAAYHAGLSLAQGDLIVTLDSDLQDPPELIPKLVQKMTGGFDIVYGRRVPPGGGSWGASGHSGTKSLGAYLFHLIMSQRKHAPIPRNVGEFRCMRREIVQHLMQFPEYMIFLPGLVANLGFTVDAVDYIRQRRESRVQASVWSLSMRALDALTTFSVLPLNFIFGLTCVTWVFPAVAVIWIGANSLRTGGLPSLTALAWLAALVGWCVTMTTLGVIAHYLGRMFLEIKARPRYFIKRTVGFPPA